MKKTVVGAAVRKEREIYLRQWLDEQELFLVLDGRHVHIPSLLAAIPHEVLLHAASSLETAAEPATQSI